MPKKPDQKDHKLRLVVDNVVSLADAREERNENNLPTIYIAEEELDKRSQIKDALEEADRLFHNRKNIDGIIITLVENNTLYSFTGGLTLEKEILYRQWATDNAREEWLTWKAKDEEDAE